jgi:L-ascorbate metabolism protein UlaG (beta-lactamase superfamily)
MDIKYIGHSSFQIKGKSGTVVTDPFDSKMVGLKYPSLEADIITVSHEHPDHNVSNIIGGNPLLLNIPGEYEKQGIRVTGYLSYHDNSQGKERGKNTLFKIEMEDISVLHCGDLGHLLGEELIEEIDTVDILLIPVGGFYTINADDAVKVISKLEPSLVIPMHYNHDKLDQKTFGQMTPLSDFLTKMGAFESEPVKKLSVKKADLIEGTKVVVMEISN